MNTFIMMWNPAISNWKMEDFELTLCHFDDVEFNWAIYDYKKVKEGDRFFLVRCAETLYEQTAYPDERYLFF